MYRNASHDDDDARTIIVRIISRIVELIDDDFDDVDARDVARVYVETHCVSVSL